MPDHVDGTPVPMPRLPAGQAVEVRDRYTGDWGVGFEVSAAVDGGYQVRRMRDGFVLPEVFEAADVRVARPAAQPGV